MPTQESLNQLLAFLNLYQHEKKNFVLSFHFLDAVSSHGQCSQSPMASLPNPFFDKLLPQTF